MKVLVTGGSGYIGTPLCKKLKADNFDLKTHQDILDFKKLERAIKGCDVVFHLASPVIVRDSFYHPWYYWKNIVLGTKNVVDLCLKYKARLIFTSTKLVEERCRLCNCLQSPYARAKLQAEKIISKSLKNYAILRLPNIYDDEEIDPYKGRLIPRLKRMAKNGTIKIFPPETDVVELILLDEIVDVLISYLKFPSGIFRIYGNPLTIGQLAHQIAKRYDAKVIITEKVIEKECT